MTPARRSGYADFAAYAAEVSREDWLDRDDRERLGMGGASLDGLWRMALELTHAMRGPSGPDPHWAGADLHPHGAEASARVDAMLAGADHHLLSIRDGHDDSSSPAWIASDRAFEALYGRAADEAISLGLSERQADAACARSCSSMALRALLGSPAPAIAGLGMLCSLRLPVFRPGPNGGRVALAREIICGALGHTFFDLALHEIDDPNKFPGFRQTPVGTIYGSPAYALPGSDPAMPSMALHARRLFAHLIRLELDSEDLGHFDDRDLRVLSALGSFRREADLLAGPGGGRCPSPRSTAKREKLMALLEGETLARSTGAGGPSCRRSSSI